eukprot:14028376-Alexandrium_andersonii.AAC.1
MRGYVTMRRCKVATRAVAKCAARAAIYPPALCAAILWGVAAQRAREGRPILPRVASRLDRGAA